MAPGLKCLTNEEAVHIRLMIRGAVFVAKKCFLQQDLLFCQSVSFAVIWLLNTFSLCVFMVVVGSYWWLHGSHASLSWKIVLSVSAWACHLIRRNTVFLCLLVIFFFFNLHSDIQLIDLIGDSSFNKTRKQWPEPYFENNLRFVLKE